MTPDEYCQQKAAASGSSFYYSFLFLPADRRRAITALYAFCRGSGRRGGRDHRSSGRRGEARVVAHGGGQPFRRQPQHPVDKALAVFTDRFAIGQDRLNEIIDGMEDGLTLTRYLDWPGLERYCYRVAGAVGPSPPTFRLPRRARSTMRAARHVPKPRTSFATSARTHARIAFTFPWRT